MGTRQIGSTDDSSQIMGILDIIQQENKGRLTLFLRCFQDVIYLRVLISRRVSDDALMFSGLG